MKNTFNIKTHLIIVLEYLLGLLIILDCNSIFIKKNDASINTIKIIACGVIFALIILQLRVNKCRMKRYIFIISVLIIYLLIFTVCSVASNSIFSFISRFVIILPLFILLIFIYSDSGKEFKLFYCISNIMTVLGGISIFLWLLCSVFKILSFNNIVYINWGGYHSINGFYNLYYETQPINFFEYSGYRNTGIFTEAPMFSLCLSIALITEFFLRGKLNIRRICILSATIITTFSTTGYIVLIMCIGAEILKNKNFSTKSMLVLKILFVILAICFGTYIIYSLFIEKMNTNSFNDRIDKYINEFNKWKTNIIMGTGYGNNEDGSSNSLMVILADGGLWLGLIYVLPIIMFVSNKKNINFIYFGLVFLWLIIVTVFPYSLIMYTVLGLGYKMIVSKNINRGNE